MRKYYVCTETGRYVIVEADQIEVRSGWVIFKNEKEKLVAMFNEAFIKHVTSSEEETWQ